MEGVSSARNMGLLEAKGEYICFVDSDGYVASEFVEKLYNAIQKYKVDISSCAYRRVTDDNYSLLVQNKANEIEEYYISADDKWSNVLRNSHSAEGFLWNKMFAKNCLAWNRPENWVQEFQNKKKQWKEENVNNGHNLEERIYKRSGIAFMIYCFVRSKMSKVKQSINKLR